jgi:glycosyltransferase involved in cell wall biosynthesis
MVCISLGLPVYNGEAYIRDCIESILAQTFRDFELVISDNASTDSTPQICREFAERDRRIRVITQERNIGAANNFNLLFHETQGEFFKWCAHDDLLHPDFLKVTFEHLRQDPVAVLCHSYTVIFTDDGEADELFMPELVMDRLAPAQRLNEVMVRGQRCYEVFGLIRRSALRKSGLIGNHTGGDNVLLFQLALQGTFAIVPEPLFRLRRHARQSTTLLYNSQGYHEWFTGRVRRISFPEWLLLHRAWMTPSEIGLPFSDRIACYRALMSETWRFRARLRQNIRVAIETLIFGSSEPTRRRRLLGKW